MVFVKSEYPSLGRHQLPSAINWADRIRFSEHNGIGGTVWKA